jgi:nitrate/nitrite transporter NarK
MTKCFRATQAAMINVTAIPYLSAIFIRVRTGSASDRINVVLGRKSYTVSKNVRGLTLRSHLIR